MFKKMGLAIAGLMVLSGTALAQGAGPLELRCAGTEPFWGVTVSRGRMVYSSPGTRNAALRIVSVASAAGMSPDVVRVIKSQFARLTVIAGTCSDGMSDTEYAYHAVYENGPMTLYGCCNARN